MLIGRYDYAIDEKGRLNFPAKFREDMGKSFVVTCWLDGCLAAFPAEEWERVTGLLREKSMVKAREVQRYLYASATEASPDKQGRILSPQHLRKAACLEKDVTIIGLCSRVEIWNTQAWEAHEQQLREGPIADAMEELDF